MADPTLLVIDRGVATITLDYQERRNSFGQALLQSLLGNIEAAVSDSAVRVIVLTNRGNVFSAGADLKEDRSTLGPDAPTFEDVVAAIDASPKPVVGRIAGHAAGGGAAVVIACDLAVIVDSARIGITEVRLGIAPVPVAAMLVHRLTPMALYESFLAADMMPASRAATLGLVNAAVSAEDLDATVEHYVDCLRRGAPGALAETKRALQAMLGHTAGENEAAADGHVSDEGVQAERREGIAAFLDKRDPAWIPAASD